MERKKIILTAAIALVAFVVVIIGVVGIAGNNISKKINIEFSGDENVFFEKNDTKVNKDKELIYEVKLNNTTGDAISYSLAFDNPNEVAYKYIEMELLKDGVSVFNGSLEEMLDNSVFELGKMEPLAGTYYKFIFKSKKKSFKFNSGIKIDYEVVGDIPNKVTVTMPLGTQTERNFTWHTAVDGNGYVQVVKAKDDNQSLANFIDGEIIEVASYTEIDKFYEYVHKAKVNGLEPGTKYYYRVGNKVTNEWSNIGEFITDDGDSDFSFLYLADMQTYDSNFDPIFYTVRKALETNKNAEFLVSTGDLVNIPTEYDEWNKVLSFSTFGNLTGVVAAGNHDYDYLGDGSYIFDQNFSFDLPEKVNYATGLNYSFNYGSVHFIVLNTNDYHFSSLSWDQEMWLKNDLYNSQELDFRVVILHRGPYITGPHYYDYGDSKALTEQLTPIFAQFNVDLVLQGHDHIYGLTYPIDENGNAIDVNTKKVTSDETGRTVNTMVNPGGPVYFVGGAVGSLYHSPLELEGDKYVCMDKNNCTEINASKDEIDAHYSKFQKIDLPKSSAGNNLALFSSIEVKGNTLLVNTYSVDNENEGEVKLYNSFGISK